MLEVGCGTGLFSTLLVQELGWEGYRYTFNDLLGVVEPILRAKLGSAEYTFVAGDAEEYPWPSAHFQLVTSASSIQWWHYPLRFISKAAQALAPGGVVAFSTFLPSNLHQLAGVTGHSLHYHTTNEYRQALQQAGFTEIELHEVQQTLHFDNLMLLLRHLKQTGTNALTLSSHPFSLTPTRITQLEHHYRSRLQLAPHLPLPLTYVALLATARKPS